MLDPLALRPLACRLAPIATALLLGCGTPLIPDSGEPTIRLPILGIGAHRGASFSHPENTLVAFREAVGLGAHQITLDVRASRDQHLVVIHDPTVDRTTNGRGRVDTLTLDQIKRLDAGSWKHSRFRGETVPTLVESLRILPPDVWINLQVRGNPWVAEEVARVVIEENRIRQVVLSVDPDAAAAVQEVHPDVRIASPERRRSREASIEGALANGADFIEFSSRRGLPSPTQIGRVRVAGIRVNYCCERDPTRLPGLFALGIDFPIVADVAAAMHAAAALDVPPPASREP